MSSSAPAEPTRAQAGAVAALVGSALFKLATAAGLVTAGEPLLPVLGGSIVGFGFDALLVILLLLLGQWWPRIALVAGTFIGILGGIDVYFALRFGAPLTPSQWAWASSVVWSQAGWPALLGIAAVALVVLSAAKLRPPSGVLTISAVVLLLLGALGRLVEDADKRRRLGLDESPLLALLQPIHSKEHTVGGEVDGAITDPDPSWSAPVAVATTTPPRHVVIFLSESTATRFVDDSTMPRLKELQRGPSLTFLQHSAQSPISIKAIFSVLCGVHPDPTAQLETSSVPRIGCASLPETLSAHGFDAALFHGGYFAFTDKLAFLGERGFQRLVDGENLPGRDQHWHNGWGVDDRAVVNEALAWFDGRKDRHAPSLLVLVPLVPHHEYFLPPDAATPFGTRTLLDRYKNGLHFADDVFGRVVDAYRARGVADETLFVFVGDHGEAFDEHPRNRLHGSFLYEENVSTPLVLVSTKLFGSAQTSARPSSHADILPTILDLLQLPPPDPRLLQGQSLVSSSFGPRPVPLFTAVPTQKVGMRTPGFKLVHDVNSNSDELYDLHLDPQERHNLASEQPQLTTRLRSQALSFLALQPGWLRSVPGQQRPTWLARAAAAAGLPLVEQRVFNMARRCVPLMTSTTTETVLLFPLLDPPARSLGVGVTDESRAAKRGSITIDVEGTTVIVDDAFLNSSRVIELAPSRSSLRVQLRASPTGASGCLWLAP